MGWLKGEVALITGGGSGLGWALVERFLEEGAHVGVLQRSQSKVDALKERFGDQIVAVAGDVANYEDNVHAVQATVERFGKLDCFIGNAGIWDMPISSIPLASSWIKPLMKLWVLTPSHLF